MAEYAPAAITAAWELIHDAIPSAKLSGIQGDSAHTYGYHRGRNYCTDPNDYSIQHADDKKGNGDACSALDVTLSDADMVKVTQRLIDATHAGDPALAGLRSFIGTTNGRDVIGMDVPGRYYITSDNTHLWHVHFSGTRKYADDMAAWADIAAVTTGEDMPTAKEIAKEVWQYDQDGAASQAWSYQRDGAKKVWQYDQAGAASQAWYYQKLAGALAEPDALAASLSQTTGVPITADQVRAAVAAVVPDLPKTNTTAE